MVEYSNGNFTGLLDHSHLVNMSVREGHELLTYVKVWMYSH